MDELLRVALGLVLTCAVLATGAFLARALMSKNPVATASTLSTDSWTGKLYASAALLGWFAVVSAGVHSVLAIYLGHLPDLTWWLAGIAALGTTPLLGHFNGLPQMRRDCDVLAEVVKWERGQLRSYGTTSAQTVQGFLDDSRAPEKTSVERLVLVMKHEFAASLKARDEGIEAGVLTRLARARDEELAKLDRERANAEAAAKVVATRAKDQEELQRAEAILDKHVKPLPVAKDLSGIEDEAVVDLSITLQAWATFKSLVAEVCPSSPEAVNEAQARLAKNLQQLPGVSLPPGFRAEMTYSGNTHDGFCDATAHDDTGSGPLHQRLQYEHTLLGLNTAIFFAGALPRQWSWGHGFYNRDHELIVSRERLLSIIREAAPAEPVDSAIWPPPGIRIKRLNDGFEVSCLSTRPGPRLYDLSIEVRAGVVTALNVTDVLATKNHVFY